MDELEQILSELRQGLGQQTFYYLERLKQHVSDEDAISYLVEEIQKIEDVFVKANASSSSSLFNELNDLQANWSHKSIEAAQKKEYDTQYEAEEVLKAIKTVRSAMKEKD